METSERIVEAYVRYVKGWATIANLRCRKGQREIDLIAVNPASGERYHIETGVSISGAFSKLTLRAFSNKKRKERVGQPKQRRTLGYFVSHKFGSKDVHRELKRFGFEFRPPNYTRVIVTWGAERKALRAAERKRIEVWDMRDLITEIADKFGTETAHYGDDTLRTVQLHHKALEWKQRRSDEH